MGQSADDWVMDVATLWAAAIGAAGALGAVGMTRWFDIRQLRQLWAHDERVRWLQDRQQAYARLMTALDDWDVAVDKAVAQRHTDAVTGGFREYDSAEWDELRRAARAAQGVVELMAPEWPANWIGPAPAARERCP